MTNDPDQEGAAAAHDAKAAMELAQQVRLLFVGKSPDVQGAALADLLSTWLAGHVVGGDFHATADLRAALLEAHLAAVRELVPIDFRRYVKSRRPPQ